MISFCSYLESKGEKNSRNKLKEKLSAEVPEVEVVEEGGANTKLLLSRVNMLSVVRT